MTRLLALSLLTLGLLSTLHVQAESKAWIEVKSPHFRVITDGSQGDARHVAAEFEQMRHLFELRFPGFRLDSGAPLTIVAARNLDTARELEPELWKHNENIAGEFHHGWEKQFAAIRMDTWGEGAHQVVYHEYTHSILHLNAHWLPTWLDEGLAEFYAYTRFQSDRIYIGAPTERARTLQTHSLLPVETVIHVDQRSPYYHEEEKAQVFYADSWALVHYMIFGPGMNGGALLNQFYELIEKGVPQQQAFVQVFGDPKVFDLGWNRYMGRLAFSAGVIPAGEKIDEKSFAERKLSPAETELDLGAFHIGAYDLKTGAALVDAALRDDPQLAAAHEEKAFLLFRSGEKDQARKEFTQAFSLDGTLYRSLYARTMLSPEASATDAASQAAFQANLQKVVTLNPRFAPAFVELAELSLHTHDYKTAFAQSRQAEALEPSRAGYHLLTGRILLASGQGASAANFARYVAERWWGPDNDEALELWDKIPAAQRPAGVTLAAQPLFGNQPGDSPRIVAGTLMATHCGGPKEPFTATLETGEGPRTFYQLHGFLSGFADTLWYGEDHFTQCHNLEGSRAVIAYKPSADANFAGELVNLEIREDAPVQAAAPPPAGKAAVATLQQ